MRTNIEQMPRKITCPKYLTFFLISIILINYFEIYYQYLLIELIGGYVIKSWFFPFIAFFIIIMKRLLQNNLTVHTGRFSWTDFPLVLYFLTGSVSLIMHERIYYVGKFGLIMFAPLILYIAIVEFFQNNKDLDKTLKILFFFGFIFSLIAHFFYLLPQSFLGSDTLQLKYMLTDTTHIVNWTELRHIQGFGYGNFAIRQTLPGIDEPTFAAMLSPLILFGFFYAINCKGLLRWSYYISSFFMFDVLIKTLTRSSFLAFIAGLIPFLFYIRRRIRDVLIILLTLTIIVLNNQSFQYRIYQLVGSIVQRCVQQDPTLQKIIDIKYIEKLKSYIYFDNEGHLDSISETIKNSHQALFLGSGFSYIDEKYKNDRWYAEHNRYLFILSTAGLLTLIPYVAFILGLIFMARKTFLIKLKSNESIQDIGMVLYPSVILFAIQINNAGMERYYYWIFFGFAAAWVRNTRKELKNEDIIN